MNSVGANARGVSVRRFRVSRASADGLNFFVRLVQAAGPECPAPCSSSGKARQHITISHCLALLNNLDRCR